MSKFGDEFKAARAAGKKTFMLIIKFQQLSFLITHICKN